MWRPADFSGFVDTTTTSFCLMPINPDFLLSAILIQSGSKLHNPWVCTTLNPCPNLHPITSFEK
jgi:hypothetical protein